jgi:xanthine dehydrogenase accessory factor
MAATIVVRGGGDLATGVALRLHRVGLNVVMTELPNPLAVRRTVSFAEAVHGGTMSVEGVSARGFQESSDLPAIRRCLTSREIPVIVDPECSVAGALKPLVIVDGRMIKVPPEPLRHSALLLIGLGPGFSAPSNCHAVIETQRGHTMGRVIWAGAAERDSRRPDGDDRRVLRAPSDGLFASPSHIGQHFEPGELIGSVGSEQITAPFAGTLRGLLRPDTPVIRGMKVGDIDPRDDPSLCNLVSDKSLAIGGGVLEAILTRQELRSAAWA